MPNLIALPRLASELKKLTGVAGPSYRRLYFMALDGRLTIETINGRHFVRSEDLPEIAAILGLTVPPALVAA